MNACAECCAPLVDDGDAVLCKACWRRLWVELGLFVAFCFAALLFGLLGRR